VVVDGGTALDAQDAVRGREAAKVQGYIKIQQVGGIPTISTAYFLAGRRLELFGVLDCMFSGPTVQIKL
jgi:hypothetical protein